MTNQNLKFLVLYFILLTTGACSQSVKQENNQIPDIEKGDSQIDKKASISSDSIEEFKIIDVSKLNAELSQKTTIISPKDIMKMYYPYVPGREGNQEIIISDKTLSSGNVEVTLIHDNMLDDSMKGAKYIMELKKLDDNWTVLSLKKNWKCWADRGHTNWGIKLCI